MSLPCAWCSQPRLTLVYGHTCSRACHEAWIDALITQFGPTKIIVDAASGKRYAVPTRDILARGIAHADLTLYPLADEPPLP